MSRVHRLLPSTLSGRIFVLYALLLVLPLLGGVALFVSREFTSTVEESVAAARALADVVTPGVSDSVVIGDFDTVQRTLAKLVRHSPFEQASFIDVAGGRIVARQALQPPPPWVSDWLIDQVAGRTGDINVVINPGGRDYGVLRLQFAPQLLATRLAQVLLATAILGALVLGIGLALITVSVRSWLGPLRHISYDAPGGVVLAGGVQAPAGDAPIEIRRALDAFARREAEFRVRQITSDAILSAVGDGVLTVDASGSVVHANPAAARILGRDVDDLMGARLQDLLPALDATPDPTGTQSRWGVCRLPPETADGTPRHVETTRVPLTGAAGVGLGQVLTFRDVTQQRDYEARLESELELRRTAVRRLDEALHQLLPQDERAALAAYDMDLTAVAELVTGLVQQREADRVALNFRQFALDQHAAVSIADGSGAIVHANAKLCELSGYSREELLGQRHNVMSSGLHPPEFFAQLWQTITSGTPWHGEVADRHKDGSLFWVDTTIVPALGAEGELNQYIAIRTDISARKRAEQALQAARERELATGREIQRTLLIGDLPAGLPGVEVGSYNQPSRGIDGDFYTFTPLGEGSFELLIGDVMGKGVPAALVGAAVRTTYSQVVTELLARSTSGRKPPTPAEIVNALHQRLTPRLIEFDTFVTLALYRCDRPGGRITHVNAGHTAGLLLGPQGRRQRLLGNNLPLGVLEDERYEQLDCPLLPGAALLVYSDGITEAHDAAGTEFGEERLGAAVTEVLGCGGSARLALEAVQQRLLEHAGRGDRSDDETAVLVCFDAEPAPDRAHDPVPRVRRFSLGWNLPALAELRQAVADLGRDARIDEDTLGRVELACFEAATNVIRHAPCPFKGATLTCTLSADASRVVAELWHLGAPFVPAAEPAPDFSGNSEGGFGLYIIRSTATRVEHAQPADGICRIRLEFARDPVADVVESND